MPIKERHVILPLGTIADGAHAVADLSSSQAAIVHMDFVGAGAGNVAFSTSPLDNPDPANGSHWYPFYSLDGVPATWQKVPDFAFAATDKASIQVDPPIPRWLRISPTGGTLGVMVEGLRGIE